jgi:flagellar biosynthetic protein FlhB
MPFIEGVALAADRVFSLALKMALVLFVLGVFDYAYQKWEFEKSIRMSKQEIKEEYKQMEGDPQIKRRIRQRQRELARRRMMADVPKADVVITNPTHLAVAIRYDPKTMGAPLVLAKGEGFVALRIREIAEEHRIPVVEDRPLARALMQTEPGEEVPEALYRAVAEVLAFVYRLKDNPGAVFSPRQDGR